ncbi:MAG TPA: hypothetical protein VKN99_23460 [Polyangia bacterium]|nr:hypothetical protein [Polyangia bacterium]
MAHIVGWVLACTTFLLEAGQARVVGKSYDWDQVQALVLVNKRGVAKQALPTPAGGPAARWVSRWESLTFNQYGRELPNGGMNERGLVIEIMWLDSSVYPPADQRPGLDGLQWIQYQLDNYATVPEMVAHADEVRVAPTYGRIHYLACDRSGACAAFEYVGGRLLVSSGAALPAKVLTNNTYAESVAFLRAHAKAPPGGPGSLERFARAAQMVRTPGKDLVGRAFQILEAVSQGDYSKWNIVYDPVRLKVWFRSRASWRIKSVELGKFDPSCLTPVRMLDMADDATGDVSARFRDYDEAANRKLLSESLAPILGQLPPGVVDVIAAYPRSTACKAERAMR